MVTVGIIGTGWVGSSVAISTLQGGVARRLLLHDVRPEIAEGEAMDLAHGSSFYPGAVVGTAAIEEMRDADAVVIAAGRGGRPGESRLHLLQENAAVAREIGARLAGARGVIIVVSNPVDILTRLVVEASGLPPARVIGTGTMLDTARLRSVLGRELNLEASSIHAQVVGEHGDSEVALWSSAHIGGTLLRHWPGWSVEREGALAAEVRGAAQAIIRRKGATNHAIGLVTAALLRWIVRGERRLLTVSRMQEGALGVRDLALSLPTVVGPEGATEVVLPEMTTEEQDSLLHSAEVLRAAAVGL